MTATNKLVHTSCLGFGCNTQCGDEIEWTNNYYIDFPAGCHGFGRLSIQNDTDSSVQDFADFRWAEDGSVTLNTDCSSNISSTEMAGRFCIIDDGTNARIINRLGSTVRISGCLHYSGSVNVTNLADAGEFSAE